MLVALPLGSFLAAVLVLVPLPAHIKARNLATVAIILWLSAVNLAQGINTVIWADNVEIKAVVWCDVVTRLFIGSNVALPAACFALCMHLERIASARAVRITEADKRRQIWVDSVLCFGVPAVYIGLYYVVQGHRFDLVETIGCRPETYVSIPEFFLIRFPPIFFSLGASVYAVFAFAHFFRRRATFAKHLQGNSAALTPSRYLRLMAMAVIEMFWGLLVTAVNTYFSYRDGLRPWISWANTHSDFSRIGQFPLVLIPGPALTEAYFLWWAVPVSAYLFFVFFAFGQDTMQSYASSWEWIRSLFKLPRCIRMRSYIGKAQILHSLPRFRSSLLSPKDSAIFVKTSISSEASHTRTGFDPQKDARMWNASSSWSSTSFTSHSPPSTPPSSAHFCYQAQVPSTSPAYVTQYRHVPSTPPRAYTPI
ncbi:putative fungal pheromone GPCR, STE3-type [Rhodofomes roseus]|uniref:Fungal pheromone GPCR, STE3-type n=1 Tax=Rhodofomes roseus TaxID=34475 RepID=A0ABQ8KIR3_9APHY|nr:putative fungal pheromone GPCR, STE3-type [Rhodofomes roseus]KAH9837844.1 putative fungal pheromone GPCR, STE3-type [Rhodofomes roseus]